MATIKWCDRCGAIYDEGAPAIIKWSGPISYEKTIDLCSSCKIELKRWVENDGE